MAWYEILSVIAAFLGVIVAAIGVRHVMKNKKPDEDKKAPTSVPPNYTDLLNSIEIHAFIPIESRDGGGTGGERRRSKMA